MSIRGDAAERRNRRQGLGPLLGLAAGVGAGAVVGAVRGAGWRPSLPAGAVAAALIAMVAGSGPIILLGVSDARSWSGKDWLADLVPHAVYGMVTAGALTMLDG